MLTHISLYDEFLKLVTGSEGQSSDLIGQWSSAFTR